MFDFQNIFHVGHLVQDIDQAMADLGAAAGLEWARVQHVPKRTVWTPERGSEETPLTFVYSCGGPQHVELLCGAPGTVWDSTATDAAHHLGLWSDDVAADAVAFTSAGWKVTAAARAPEDGYGAFTYVKAPTGLIIELVASTAKPRFDAWFAGGSLGNDRDPVDA